MTALFILAVAFAIATLIIMIYGVLGMARQNEFNRKYGNRLMRLRVILQFCTLLILVLMAAVSS